MVHFNFHLNNPAGQFIQIEMHLTTRDALTQLILPIWRPGRYETTDYPARIKDLKIYSPDGQLIKYKKKAVNIWEVSCDAGEKICVRYSFYANRLDAGSTYLDEDMLLLKPVNCCFYTSDTLAEKHTISLYTPLDFKRASTVKESGGKYTFQDYFHLSDHPILCSSNLLTLSYDVEDTPFYICFHGNIPDIPDSLVKEFYRFSAAHKKQMGEFPFSSYHFFIVCPDYKHYHGVEHKDSTVIILGSSGDVFSEELYPELLGVSSHELFHAWNVTRLRPLEYNPYNFSDLHYSEAGYFLEGITSYYGDMMLRRGGVFSEQEYLEELNVYLQRHFMNEGRFSTPLNEASIDLWIDGYKQKTPGKGVSIYVKGAVLALLLDWNIRLQTQNKFSLDDVFNSIWTEKLDRGYKTEDLISALKKLGLTNADELIENYIYSTYPLETDLYKLAPLFGLSVIEKVPENVLAAQLGIITNSDKIIQKVSILSPAFGHVRPGDKLLAHEKSSTSGEVKIDIERKRHQKQYTFSIPKSQYFKYYQLEKNSMASKKELEYCSLWLKQTIE